VLFLFVQFWPIEQLLGRVYFKYSNYHSGMLENINEVAVLVTAILAVAVGSVWYSPIAFGEIWMRSIGITPEDEVMSKKEMNIAILKGIINQIIFFFAVTILVLNSNESTSIWEFAGLLVIILATQLYSSVLWEKKNFSYFLINIGYTVLVLIAGLAIITYWPW